MAEFLNILAGLKVLELAEGIAGPLCGMQLADLGADVIKVEPPQGDRSRGWGEGGAASVFTQLNRGKRSCVLDFAVDDHRAALRRLVDGADVVVVHHAPAEREALGIDWAAERAARQRLIVCELSDLGQKGELSDRAGSELVVQALSGFTRYAGERDHPCRVGYEIASIGAGMHALQAVLAALYARGEDGGGEHIHISLLGQLLSLKTILLAAQGDPDQWAGFHLNGPHWQPDIGWEARDGQVTFDFRHGQREGWEAFCRKVGLERLTDDPEYEDWRSTIYMGDRKATHGDVYRPIFARMTCREASDLINGLGGISVKFHDYAELQAHPQLAHLHPFVEVQGAGRQVGTPFRFEDAEVADPAPRPAPELGEAGGNPAWEGAQ